MDYSSLLKDYSPDEIAEYIRLSLEDRNKKGGVVDESESITNQRRIINNFIDSRGNVGSKCIEFIDDGKSGTNFDRPGWKELLDEIEAGKIKVVITKNLSRLGRSNFECSYYMDYYFPSMGVRFMTVQEEIDTNDIYNSSNEYAPLNNFMNEKYSRDLSKNVRNSKLVKQKAGEYIGGRNTPYGYKRDPEDKHHLIIDEIEARVIRLIFQWYLETSSQKAVKRKLFEGKILNPSHHRNYKRKTKNPYQWDDKTIHDILLNEVYIGCMVQHKYTKKSFRAKKLSKVPRDEWISVPNKHEAIIEKELFDRVQALMKANYKCNSERQPELLRGLLVCYDCKHHMTVAKTERIGKDGRLYINKYTQCTYYRRNRNLDVCSLHSTNYIELEKEVLEKLDVICKKFIKLVDFEKLTKQKKKNITTLGTTLENKIIKTQSEIEALDRKIEKAYMDRLDDVLSVDTYTKISSKLEEQKKDLQIVLNDLQDSYTQYQQDNTIEKYLETEKIVKQYLKTKKKIDRELIIKIVDRIEIHDDKTIDLHLKLKPLEQIS